MVIKFQLAFYLSLLSMTVLANQDASAGDVCHPSSKAHVQPSPCFHTSIAFVSKSEAAAPSALDKWVLSAYTEADSIPLNQLHKWRVRVIDDGGQSVKGLNITVDGGMPEHNHALPTQPQMTNELRSGEYEISGVKFSMYGNWVVNFRFRVNGRPSLAQVQFNLSPPSVQ